MSSDSKTARGILLVDDHPLVLAGIERLIESKPGFCVCGMAANARDALTLTEKLKPDLVIADLTLPGRNGLELIKDLAALYPDLPVIVLSMHDEMVYAERVLRAGARSYVMKDTPPERLLEAIRVVLDGGVSVSQKVTSSLLRSYASGKHHTEKGRALECLTDREMEVFELIGQAKSNHEIASQLGISPRTLDAHRAHIREKLGFTESNELTRHAIRWIEVGSIEP
jgi:DNA-binding NarL/FixJ family response regulator